jgi:hypothetical protein
MAMNEPILLMRVPTEPQAMLVQNDLAGEGIESSLEGMLTSAFRAEAPGLVSIWVDKADLPRAREIIGNQASDESRDGKPAQWTWTSVVAVAVLVFGVLSLVLAIVTRGIS